MYVVPYFNILINTHLMCAFTEIMQQLLPPPLSPLLRLADVIILCDVLNK